MSNRASHKTAVLGARAMGGWFGGTLKQGAMDVFLLDGSPEHNATINNVGPQWVGDKVEPTIATLAYTDTGTLVAVDFMPVQYKAIDADAVLTAHAQWCGRLSLAQTIGSGT